jgi:transcriptional regulator
MYVPASFEVRDEEVIEAFLKRHDFASLVSATGDGLLATQVPLVARRGPEGLVLVGHVARANGHWRAMDGRTPAVAIFWGPHDYISPTWYATAPAVPTWNYATIHAHGAPRVIDDAAFTRAVLAELVARHETGPAAWRVDALPADLEERLVRAVVSFELPVVRVETSFKLGQNRAAADRAGAIAGLERAGTPEAARLAAFMRAHAGLVPPDGQ